MTEILTQIILEAAFLAWPTPSIQFIMLSKSIFNHSYSILVKRGLVRICRDRLTKNKPVLRREWMGIHQDCVREEEDQSNTKIFYCLNDLFWTLTLLSESFRVMKVNAMTEVNANSSLSSSPHLAPVSVDMQGSFLLAIFRRITTLSSNP
jgi:hypothetical protein